MGGRITDTGQWLHRAHDLAAGAIGSSARGLRFVDDQDRACALHPFDAGNIARLFAGLLEHGRLRPQRLHRRDHHADRGRRGKIDDSRQVGAVVDKAFEWNPVIQLTEVVARLLDCFLHAFTYRDRGNDNDEFREAVAAVQLEDRAQVDVSFACPRLHFDGEVHAIVALPAAPVTLHFELGRRGKRITVLHHVQVFQDLFGQQVAAVGVAEQLLVIFQFPFHLLGRDGEEGLLLFLSGEQVHHRIDSGGLMLEVGFEFEFHGSALPIRCWRSWRYGRPDAGGGSRRDWPWWRRGCRRCRYRCP